MCGGGELVRLELGILAPNPGSGNVARRISRNSDVTGRMIFEPALAVPKQLFDLVVSHPAAVCSR